MSTTENSPASERKNVAVFRETYDEIVRVSQAYGMTHGRVVLWMHRVWSAYSESDRLEAMKNPGKSPRKPDRDSSG